MSNKIKVASTNYVDEQINDVKTALQNISAVAPYTLEFDDTNWVDNGDNSYSINIPQATHNINSSIEVDILKLTTDGYIMTHGIYDNLDYTILIGSDGNVTVTTTSKFSGIIIIKSAIITPYTLPIATADNLGGVKVDGTTITADENGVISSVGNGGMTVDTLLDITVSKDDTSGGDYSGCSPANNSIITLDRNITDYRFIYTINTLNNGKFASDTFSSNSYSSFIPSFVYVDGNNNYDFIRHLNNIVRAYLVSPNQIKFEFLSNNLALHIRFIIYGIK